MKAEDEATRSVGVLEGFGVDGLERMNASANEYDCLIHSFLTATCENFRRLDQPSKDTFANFFRRTAFIRLPVVQCFMKNHQDRALVAAIRLSVLAPKTYLTQEVIHLLAAQFRVNILTAQGQAGVNRFGIVDAGTLDLPEPCIPHEEFIMTIGIYTSGEHFEALRDGGRRYTFSKRRVADIIDASDKAWNARRAAGRGPNRNNNLNAAIAASLAGTSAKQPALNRKAIAKMLGMRADELNAFTNAQLKNFIGGGKRRTRRRRA
jgi:hypothetical protein